MENPNYRVTQSIIRDKVADKTALESIITAWPADQPDISTPALADAWIATLTAQEINDIQAVYTRGIGDYIEELLR